VTAAVPQMTGGNFGGYMNLGQLGAAQGQPSNMPV
jgi:hypothetical protein